ncbi:MAG: hypothetical protein AB7F65_00980 [Dehalococcoidia bacterium]
MTAAMFLLAACDDGGDGDDVGLDTDATTTSTATMTATATPTTPAATATAAGEQTPAGAAGETIEVTGVDFGFEGVPETVEAGTQLTFTNASDAEVHEMLMFKLPEGEERGIDELLLLPDEEAQTLVGEPLGVAVALPGQDPAFTEGEFVVSDPGRYILLCFIPTGADPAVFEELLENPDAAEGEGPEIEGGPPHVAQGMYAEFTVE